MTLTLSVALSQVRCRRGRRRPERDERTAAAAARRLPRRLPGRLRRRLRRRLPWRRLPGRRWAADASLPLPLRARGECAESWPGPRGRRLGALSRRLYARRRSHQARPLPQTCTMLASSSNTVAGRKRVHAHSHLVSAARALAATLLCVPCGLAGPSGHLRASTASDLKIGSPCASYGAIALSLRLCRTAQQSAGLTSTVHGVMSIYTSFTVRPDISYRLQHSRASTFGEQERDGVACI